MFKRTYCGALLLSFAALLLQPAAAQDLPGLAIDTATVAAEVQALIELGQQAFPTDIPSASASGWRVYEGFVFKYYAATGIYVGIKDDEVYLFGGPYTAITHYGSLAAVTSALQARITNMNKPNPPYADFKNLLIVETLPQVIETFASITLEDGTLGASGNVITHVKLDNHGEEMMDGSWLTHLTAAIAYPDISRTFDMWVDGSGRFLRLKFDGLDFSIPQAQALGPPVVDGFLSALSAADIAQVGFALAGEIQNPALSTKLTKRLVGDTEVDTIKLEVSSDADASVIAYISDFGSFAMATEFSSTLGTETTFFEIIDMTLR